MKEESEKFIEEFGKELLHYRQLMQEAFDGVLNENVSLYPVFIFHQQEVTVGIPIADRHQIVGEWSVNISTLEEFYIKGIVKMEQVEEIKLKINGLPPQYCCLVLTADHSRFIFLNRERVTE